MSYSVVTRLTCVAWEAFVVGVIELGNKVRNVIRDGY